MNVIQINIHKLKISDLNVRKILASDEDETSISDLASDIKTNGLINPITVRNKDNDNYEIIAGQRRFLACKLINMKSISCNVINVADQKAEEISLVENVQRNQMTNMDKIKSYVKLYNLYKKDIKRVTKAISISESTLKRYLELDKLPDNVLKKLDTKKDKVTLDVAVSLTKLQPGIKYLDVLSRVNQLSSKNQAKCIKEFSKLETIDVDYIVDIVEAFIIKENKIELAPSVPYVIDENGKNIIIPENLYTVILKLIRSYDDKDDDKSQGFFCKKCHHQFRCFVCENEHNIKFKHRTHCYDGQLGIDFSGREYHYCDECYTQSQQYRENCPFCGIINCHCGSEY